MITKTTDTSKHNNGIYDHYIALDWSELTMAIARVSKQGQKPHIRENQSDLRSLKNYLTKLRGTKILTIEETTSTHWLYVELKDFVDKILICDPYRNGLLKDGAKTDKIDAEKLCKLLRGDLLKEVFHSTDEAYKIRKLVSAYDDLVKAGTRIKNQKSAFYRSMGLKYKKDKIQKGSSTITFLDTHYNKLIEQYEQEKQLYLTKFNEIIKTNQTLKNLMGVNGIGPIWAITIYSIVVDANRFPDKYKYWSYCGLTYNLKESGGRIYGRKRPRYSRSLKRVFCSAAYSAIDGNNDISHYYEYLLSQGMDMKKAYNMVVRYLAKSSYAIMKNNEKYKPYLWRKD